MKPRLKQAGRWAKYTLLVIVIILGTIILVAYGRGYFYSIETGEITSGGLLSIDSRPGGANITIDGSSQEETRNEIRLTSGEYAVELHLDGYRSWTKQVSIQEAVVTYARYPLLIPDTVSSDPVQNLGSVGFVSQSDNQQYLAVIETTEGRDRVRVFEAGSAESSHHAFTMPSQLSNFTITDLVWAPDASRAFITAESPEGATRHFVFTPDTSGNGREISAIADNVFDNPVFDNAGTAVYGITGDAVLRRVPMENGPGRSLARNINAFDIYGNTVYAVQYTSDGTRLIRIEGSGSETVFDYAVRRDYEVVTIEYRDELKLVLHDTAADQVTVMDGVLSGAVATKSLSAGAAEQISISPNGQFITMRTGSYFTTYDLRRSETYWFEVPDIGAPPQWYTDHHMLAVSGNKIILFEFDGANREYLTAAQPFRAFGNRDMNTVYSIRNNQLTGRLQLQRTVLE